MRLAFARTVACACLLAAFALPLHAATLTVFAAASLTDALQAAATAYEKTSPDTFRFNFAASGILARQIDEGAPADIFFSADEARMDRLAAAGLLLPGSRRTLLANTLVLIVNREHPAPLATFADLARPAAGRLAIGDPLTVPAGTYAKKFLESRGLWSAISARAVPLANVRAVLAAVATGNADAGLVYKTDAAISSEVTAIAEAPLSAELAITYPAAIIKTSPEPAAASDFLVWLATPAAQSIFAHYGFLPPPAASSSKTTP